MYLTLHYVKSTSEETGDSGRRETFTVRQEKFHTNMIRGRIGTKTDQSSLRNHHVSD